MSPLNGTQEYLDLHDRMASELEPGSGRTSDQQAAIQIVALLVTFAVSIGGGLVTGNNFFSIWNLPFTKNINYLK